VVTPNPITILEDSTGMVCMTISDTNEGDTFTTQSCTGSPANGTANTTVNGNEVCIEYTPTTGFIGRDEVCVIVCDQTGRCDTITSPVTVIEPLPASTLSEPPLIVPTPIIATEDSTIMVCTPILDPNVGDIYTPTLCGGPMNGTATVTAMGNTFCIEFTPDAGFTGDDEVCFSVCDQTGLCDTVTMPITTVPMLLSSDTMQAPVIITTPIVATEDTPITVCSPITDPNPNSTFTATACGMANDGVATVNISGDEVCVSYTPDRNFSGHDEICIIVCDETGLCDSINAPIVVLPVNDPPTPAGDINITSVDAPVSGELLTSDEDPEMDTLAITTTPVSVTNGTVTILPNGEYEFTPAAGFSGEASFEYEVCDSGNPTLCDTATVVIEVVDNTGLGNNPVVGMEDNFTLETGNTLINNVLANDGDSDGGSLTINTTPVTAPSSGTLTIAANGDVTYIPDAAFVGEVSFEYEVCDDGIPQSCDTVGVVIEVLADDKMNDIYATDGANIADEGDPQTGNVLDNVYDPEGDTPSVNTTPVNGVSNGTLTLNADGTYSYEPNRNFIGTDQFTYEVCDDGSPMACDTATDGL